MRRIGLLADRHDTSGLTTLGAAETFVGRIGLRILMDKAQIEEKPVHDDLCAFVRGRLDHQQTLPDRAPLLRRRLNARDVFDRVAVGEVVVPAPFKADILVFDLDPSPVQRAEVVALRNADEIPVGGLINGFLYILHRCIFGTCRPGAPPFNAYIVDSAVSTKPDTGIGRDARRGVGRCGCQFFIRRLRNLAHDPFT